MSARASPKSPAAMRRPPCWLWRALNGWARPRWQRRSSASTRCCRRWPRAPSASKSAAMIWQQGRLWRPCITRQLQSVLPPSAPAWRVSKAPAARRLPPMPNWRATSCICARCWQQPTGSRCCAMSAMVLPQMPFNLASLRPSRCCSSGPPQSRPPQQCEVLRMRALITRPQEDATDLAAALTARGIEPLIEPLLEIKLIEDAKVDLDQVQALLFTSANGVRAFAALSASRDLPAYTVGEGSAAAARAAGFTHIESAGGDANAFASLGCGRLQPQDGVLFPRA